MSKLKMFEPCQKSQLRKKKLFFHLVAISFSSQNARNKTKQKFCSDSTGLEPTNSGFVNTSTFTKRATLYPSHHRDN